MWYPKTYGGGEGVDNYLIAIFSSSSCPILLLYIHEIVIIVLMIAASHSAEVRTYQIVTVEMKNA